ncbi:MAG: hypothetical protein ABIH42_08270 [Planctomycetota bacterium]
MELLLEEEVSEEVKEAIQSDCAFISILAGDCLYELRLLCQPVKSREE